MWKWFIIVPVVIFILCLILGQIMKRVSSYYPPVNDRDSH